MRELLQRLEEDDKDREIEAYRYANAVGTVQEQIDRALRSLKKA
jgi:hypothetical protein